MKAVLPIYLTAVLGFSQSRAITILHGFNCAAYSCTLLGGLLSDAVCGKFHTILYLSLVYCMGMSVLAIGAFPFESARWAAWLTLAGLALVALGTGGIKPCVSAFGGDQFDLLPAPVPHAAALLALYFSVFYFAINAGSVLAMLLTPVLRHSVHCFGADSCFPLAFGLPAVLMFLATIVFVGGSAAYLKKGPSGAGSAGILKALLCRALFSSPGSSLLASAESERDLRVFRGIIAVFAPVSIFWALYDQQSSRWTFQALLMDCRLSERVAIKPEQMGIFNALLILLLIPVFNRVIYPGLADRFDLHLRPLHRILLGMLLAMSSFAAAALLQLLIASHDPGAIHVLWQVPQYILLTCAEIMVSVTSLEFAYSESPHVLKSLSSAISLLSVAAGNLLVVLLNELVDPVGWLLGRHQEDRSLRLLFDFVFWTVVIGCGAYWFARIARSYKYATR